MSYLGPSLRHARKRSRPRTRALAALAISLLVNYVALRVTVVGGRIGASNPVPAPRSVVLAPLTRAEWEANRWASPAPPSVRAAQPPAADRVAPPPPTPNKIEGQIVDVEPSKNPAPPKDSRFVAEQNSMVEKETRSRHARPKYENTFARPSTERGRVAAGEEGHEVGKVSGVGRRSQKPEHGALRVPGQAAREKLVLKPEPRGDLALRDPRQGIRGNASGLSLGGAAHGAPPAGEEGRKGAPGQEGALGIAQLRPSAAAYDRLAGGPAPDKLDGVEEGEGTFLNTRGWKYASYFNRISQTVREQWDPNAAMRARDPSGARFGTHDWFTMLVVKLDDRGSLKDVVVQRSSGLDFLDTAAVQALRRAQPFVNPPRGLADEHGEIVFSYGFTLEGSLGLDRIFRRGPPE